MVHFNVTTHPTAEWTARQLVQAFSEETSPRFLLRDRDKTYGEPFRRAIEILGTEEVLTAAGRPGRTLTPSGSSDRFAGSVWTT